MLTRAPLPYIRDTEKVNIFNFPCSVALPDRRPEWGWGEELQGFTAEECENLEFSGKLITLSGNLAVEQG